MDRSKWEDLQKNETWRRNVNHEEAKRKEKEKEKFVVHGRKICTIRTIVQTIEKASGPLPLRKLLFRLSQFGIGVIWSHWYRQKNKFLNGRWPIYILWHYIFIRKNGVQIITTKSPTYYTVLQGDSFLGNYYASFEINYQNERWIILTRKIYETSAKARDIISYQRSEVSTHLTSPRRSNPKFRSVVKDVNGN